MRPAALAVLLALLFGAGIGLGRASAPDFQASPRWSVAGHLAITRAYADSALLDDGRILIVGGLDAKDPSVTIDRAEIFDPASGRSQLIDQPLLGRLHEGVTVTDRGMAVVTGGTEWIGGWNSVAKVDVYLPWKNRWEDAAPMHQARSSHGAARLPGGRILVAGGNHGVEILASAEIYDPLTDRWTWAAPLPKARTQFTLAPLPDGRVLAAGGFEGSGKLVRTTWIYDPAIDRWTAGPAMLEVRLNHSVARLPDGDLLFFGGEQLGAESAERYSWRTRSFEYAGMLGEPRLVAQGTALPDGRVVLVGGLPEGGAKKRFLPLAGAEVWDPSGRIWKDIPRAPTERAFAQLVVAEGRVFRFSGVGDDERPFSTVEQLAWE